MRNTKVLRVHTDLQKAFEVIGKSFADKIKKEYNLSELFISDVTASQLVAGPVLAKKQYSFRVRKITSSKGVLELQ